MPTVTKTKKNTNRVTGSEFFDLVGTKVGLKKSVVRDTVYAISDVVVDLLKKNKEVRVPHLLKVVTKFTPSKKIPAGNYANPFKRDASGAPTVEYREARTRPAKTKLKAYFASQVRKPVLGL